MNRETIDDVTAHRIKKEVSAFKGAYAILRERPIIACVRLKDVQIDNDQLTIRLIGVPTPGLATVAEVDIGWRRAQPGVPTPGLATVAEEGCDVGREWSGFLLGSRSWHLGGMVSWSLYFDPEVIRTITALAAKLPQIDSDFERCQTVEEILSLQNILQQRYSELLPALYELANREQEAIFFRGSMWPPAK
jgi:hypothetical protein